ncbi:MAG TPA: 2,3-bisphosphoglycerate-independent phosphoglycerate mutase [bacterium]|nr:2,3-bisphosphoglycerate-independent phosphoglycerate mutase [Chlamydiota bacterium]HOE28031.1 2,3-bisphosphoglycerate-independent phosphoglycerate mutase [bacterium]HQM52484.1 2,3-bisphosphoglycerate-independent phosphoglycerate mutase [bacterium]
MNGDYAGLIGGLVEKTGSRIVLVVADGLGGLPAKHVGLTELEEAGTPNLDLLAPVSSLGLLEPVGPGVTPGSGPAHLALFGYDPVRYNIGRGVLEGLGIDFPLTGRDVAARFNFATVDGGGNLVDRRAGRPSTEENRRLVGLLRAGLKAPEGCELFIETVKEHRGLLVLRGDGLSGEIHDTDPQELGVPPLPARACAPAAEKTASIVNELVARAAQLLAGEKNGNMLLLRGFAKHEPLPTMADRYGLDAFAVAQYPMYRGLARLVGMTVGPHTASAAEDLDALAGNFDAHTFFYLHFKKTDSRGEDGDFRAKVAAVEELDAMLPAILALKPDVLAVTADHSTPARLAMHSWHPVPLLIHSPFSRPAGAARFTERHCAAGALGLRPSVALMPILLAHARKLAKFGA